MARTISTILLTVLLVGAVLLDLQLTFGSPTGIALFSSVMLTLGVYYAYTKEPTGPGAKSTEAIAARMAVGLVSIALATHVVHDQVYGKVLVGIVVLWYCVATALHIKNRRWGFSFTTYVPVFAAGISLAVGNHWLSAASIFALMFAGNALTIVGMDMGRRTLSWSGVAVLWLTGLILATTP